MRIRSLVVAVAATALAGACARSAGTQASPVATGTEATATQTAVSSPTPSSTEGPTAEASPVIEDGRNFAFIKSVDATADPPTVTYDLAYFLTGDAATKAAKDHGDETPPPNDYYIVNDNPRLRTVALASGARLVLLDWKHCCDETFEGDLTDFAKAFDTGEFSTGGRTYKGNLSAYWLVARHGSIVKIEEQYLP
jgi:hypothetical protein